MLRIKNGDSYIKAYELEDAEELIAALAERYKDDVTPISKGGRNRNKYFYYNYPCSFDIETTTLRSGELDYFREDGRPAALVYLCQFNIYGNVIMVRTQEDAIKIFDWLALYFICSRRRRLVIFDHNLGFEYSFFRDLWQLDPGKCFAIDIHHPVTLIFKNGLMLRDSFKMTNLSLQTLTKDWSRKWFKNPEIMDYSLQRTPYTALDNDTLLYSALDVLSLSDAMEHFLAARGTGVWTNSPTSTSFIRADLKKKIGIGIKERTKEQKQYQKTLARCRISPEIYSMLRRQARGGNTHANRKYTGQLIGDPAGSGVVHFDITSSYPAQMVCYPEFPVHYWRPLDPDCSIDTVKLFEAGGYCTLFDVVLIRPRLKDNIPVPYLPTYKCKTLKGSSLYSDNGRYLEGAEMLELTIFGIEWPIIEDHYDYDDVVILRGWYSLKGYLPDIVRRFVLDLYAKKTELKGLKGQEVEYALAKTYVNGVYGMSYTAILRDKCIFDRQGIVQAPPADPEQELERYQKSTSYFMPYAWGAMVATLGRVYLQRMIDAVGYDNFLYCDTDSIFAKDPAGSRVKIRALEQDIKAYQRQCGMELTYYDIKGRPHELGGIDEEPECCFKSFGAKKYITVEDGELKCTIAGVPKAAGARIIGSPDNFKLGMVFRGADTNKLCLWYNDDEGLIVHDELGRPVRIYSNVAMLPVNYILSLSDDYSLCLQTEGINELYSFKDNDKNVIEEFIN